MRLFSFFGEHRLGFDLFSSLQRKKRGPKIAKAKTYKHEHRQHAQKGSKKRVGGFGAIKKKLTHLNLIYLIGELIDST